MGVSSTDAPELTGASPTSAGSAAGSSYPPGIDGMGGSSVSRGSWFLAACARVVADVPGGSMSGPKVAAASPPAGGRARQEKGAAPSRFKGAAESASPDSIERNAGTAGSGTSRVGATGAPSLAGTGMTGTTVSLAGSSNPPRSITVGTGGAAGVETGEEAGGWPHARPASGGRATGTGGGRTSVKETSGSSAAGAAASRWADASKTSLHWPQRTHPSEMRNWSATTLNVVEQDGQRVIWLISAGL